MQRPLLVSRATKWLTCAACAIGFATGAEAAPCEPEPSDMAVAFGELITCDIAPNSDTDLFRFTAKSGDRVLVEALALGPPGLTPRIRLIAPSGADIAEAFSPALLDVVLPQTGTYTAVIFDHGFNNSGQYSFVVSCTGGECPDVLPAPPEGSADCEAEPTDMAAHYGTRVTCDIAPSADTDLYRFAGVEGDRAWIEAIATPEGGGALTPRIRVFAPDGTGVGEVFSPAVIDLVLPQTGIYTVVVFDHGFNNPGEYAFTVTCTGGTCVPPGGQPVLTLTLTGCTQCHTGDQFTVQARFANAGTKSVRTEVKVGLLLPDGTKANVLGNKHLEVTLPAGLNTTSTLLTFAWPAGLPPGTWTLEGTLLGPDLGETYSRDVNVFTVLP
jgi:hypothetical protein